MSGGDEIYNAVTRIFGVVIAVFGVVIVVVTLAHGGGIGATGLWLGLLFVGLGVGRSYLAWRTR